MEIYVLTSVAEQLKSIPAWEISFFAVLALGACYNFYKKSKNNSDDSESKDTAEKASKSKDKKKSYKYPGKNVKKNQ